MSLRSSFKGVSHAEGVFTALVTPFKKNGEIDRDSLKKIVDFQIKEGISGLVPMGTTGESPTVSIEENMDVVEMVVKLADGKVPVIAGTGSNCTDEAIRMTKMAKNMGADYSLQVNPYYNKPTQEGLYRHFMAIADAVDLPMVRTTFRADRGESGDGDPASSGEAREYSSSEGGQRQPSPDDGRD